ncbi:MAG: membrane protein insertion efficiency factor YidD [Candidatus Blackburnbacteria bacterium]|nr:membrane protein insertion efficiency factor YidD [Candidatus Blackburnbacteria bacterium]
MLKNAVCFLIRTYQIAFGGKSGLLSFVVGGGCPQSPTCSEYTYQAVKRFGVLSGLKMGAGRVFRCNQLNQP